MGSTQRKLEHSKLTIVADIVIGDDTEDIFKQTKEEKVIDTNETLVITSAPIQPEQKKFSLGRRKPATEEEKILSQKAAKIAPPVSKILPPPTVKKSITKPSEETSTQLRSITPETITKTIPRSNYISLRRNTEKEEKE